MCGMTFEVRPSEKQRYCSMACSHQGPEVRGGLAKGHEKQRTNPHPQSAASRAKYSEWRAERRTWWAGDEVGYHGLHQWVDRHFEDPGVCWFCGGNAHLQWARRHNESTSRERNAWLRLCARCHYHYDRCLRAPYCQWCGENKIPFLHSYTPDLERMREEGRKAARKRWGNS